MSKREPALYLLDVLIAYEKILRYTENFEDGDAFLHSELEWDATIRELEIIGEATKNLIQENIIDNTNRRIVNFRNQIAHGYFGIDADIVLDVIRDNLKQFTQILQNLEINLDDAIELAKKEHAYNKNTLKLLELLKEKSNAR
ncbi:MAG: DUF86 domain-containing protein [Sulfurimonas sp.]|jgi:uncharacterized protein with HEPN domain|nr:DUF86 domain-containing protein [Sulfurimonas sp.]